MNSDPRECRVAQVDAAHFPARLGFERRAQKRRLAGAGLANQHGDRLGRCQPVLEVAQRLAVARREEEEPRVRRELEWQLAQAIELLVHDVC